MFLSRAIPSTILSNSGFGIRFSSSRYSIGIHLYVFSFPHEDSVHAFDHRPPRAVFTFAFFIQHKGRLTFARDGPLLRRNLSKCSNPHPKLLSGEGLRAFAP